MKKIGILLNSQHILKDIKYTPANVLEPAWSHVISYGRAGLVVEVVITADILIS
jgi:hypothetical protein